MPSFYRRQDLDDIEEELPLGLNPSVLKELPVPDSFFRSQLPTLDALNSKPRPLIPSQAPDPIDTKPLPKSQVPPRPKPPVPSEYFVYPKRSWRSMTKEQVRMHILDRYGARQRYNAAYKEWEEKHSKWVFGVYHLVRAVTKSKRREMEAPAKAPQEQGTGDPQEPGVPTTATDVIADLDVDFETALTALQEDAEADELDRVKRWWIQATRQNRPEKKSQCSSTPVLPMLGRQGNGTFGSQGSNSQERQGTPDIDLPPQAARKIHSSMSSCIPPKLLQGHGELSMSETEDDEDEDEEEKEDSSPSWRIYSDQCACGYAGCHCRSWMRWWNKTFQMLKYVEYVDLPISMSGVSGVPTPGVGFLGGPATRYTRVSVGERCELVKREPPVRSLHKLKSSKSKKRPWSFKELTKREVNPRPIYCSRATVKQQGNQNGSASAPSMQTSHKYIFKMHWEDFFQINPKIPGEYLQSSTLIINQRASLCTPRSAVPAPQWPPRNRALQWIAYVQYTYRLPSEIFFLAINLLDRYVVGYQQIARLSGAQWDLVGFVCLWLAWKYENYTSVPPLDDLITHSELPQITRDEVIYAECTVRNTIGLDLFYTSPLTLMRLGLTVCGCTRETKYVARFLADISTTVRHLTCCPSSRIGPVAAWLACILTGASLPVSAR
ncbi:hypothetical protein OPQ81_000906 [Rhizoctonia solani]|nr:hypothetical protein OPQ81_000906 [Rhizoctonia solani]